MSVTTTLITQPEQVVQALYDVISDNAERIGIQFVGLNDERLLPRYPAVVVSAGQKTKTLHATHTFGVELYATLWVYHAVITKTHKERSMEDMALATALEALLDDNKTLSDLDSFGDPIPNTQRVIFSFVESAIPGVYAPRSGRGEPVVGTKINWYATSQQRWT